MEGDIKKNVISTFMKCGIIHLLWRKFFLNTANIRDHIINYCNRLCREWFSKHNSDGDEKRVLDDNLNNNYLPLW